MLAYKIKILILIRNIYSSEIEINLNVLVEISGYNINFNLHFWTLYDQPALITVKYVRLDLTEPFWKILLDIFTWITSFRSKSSRVKTSPIVQRAELLTFMIKTISFCKCCHFPQDQTTEICGNICLYFFEAVTLVSSSIATELNNNLIGCYLDSMTGSHAKEFDIRWLKFYEKWFSPFY